MSELKLEYDGKDYGAMREVMKHVSARQYEQRIAELTAERDEWKTLVAAVSNMLEAKTSGNAGTDLMMAATKMANERDRLQADVAMFKSLSYIGLLAVNRYKAIERSEGASWDWVAANGRLRDACRGYIEKHEPEQAKGGNDE